MLRELELVHIDYPLTEGKLMTPLRDIQNFQLKLIESASISESCAADLSSILRKLTAAEASSVLEIIGLLQSEADKLQKLSRDLTAQRYTAIF
ncbi:hypothetical protein ACKUG4_01385 [Pseudomonas glycinae]|uniref:hypothetical protein n=1 Tax=Candidatus Pseudomonas auctus TaxID=3461260 RepID=UPI003B8F1F5B